MIYCRTKFGKGILGRGMGFGNRLFAWSRCRIFARLHCAQMISPVWLRPAVGQIFRGGIDYGSYLNQLVLYGLFCKRSGDLGVIEGFMKTRNIPVFPEPELLDTIPLAVTNGKDVTFLFSGYERYFLPLNGWHDFLLAELRAITRPKYLALVESFGEVPIGLCVRCGNDFAEPSLINGKLQLGQKTPVSWFVQCLKLIREVTNYPFKAVVVSDGTDEQLRELLALENVIFARPGSAISDLLVLARARVLIGSGSSSFAAWGCFFGQMPSISHFGQPFTDWGILPLKGQYIGEFSPSDPAPVFLEQIKDILVDNFKPKR